MGWSEEDKAKFRKGFGGGAKKDKNKKSWFSGLKDRVLGGSGAQKKMGDSFAKSGLFGKKKK